MKRPAQADFVMTVKVHRAVDKLTERQERNQVQRTLVCGKCSDEVRTEWDGTAYDRLPKGWQWAGAKLEAVKCGKCNATCSQMHRAGLSMTKFKHLSMGGGQGVLRRCPRARWQEAAGVCCDVLRDGDRQHGGEARKRRVSPTEGSGSTGAGTELP